MIYGEGSEDGANELDSADGYAGDEAIHAAAGFFENGGRIEDDGVDAAKLLEEHEGQ